MRGGTPLLTAHDFGFFGFGRGIDLLNVTVSHLLNMVQGAALADFTMISGFDVDITQVIPNGALVEVDPTGARPFIRIV